jgi:hypothetical protein
MYLTDNVCCFGTKNVFSNEPYHSCMWSVLLNTKDGSDKVWTFEKLNSSDSEVYLCANEEILFEIFYIFHHNRTLKHTAVINAGTVLNLWKFETRTEG